MKLTEFFISQLEREAKSTRRVLENVPAVDVNWKPHPKSMPLGYLASLVSAMPAWIQMMVDADQYDLASKDPRYNATPSTSSADLVKFFDQSVTLGLNSLRNTTDEHLQTRWKLLVGGRVVSDEIRHMAITDAVFSHLAHHRGQLTVYLRLNEAKVPSVYGPSADEPV